MGVTLLLPLWLLIFTSAVGMDTDSPERFTKESAYCDHEAPLTITVGEIADERYNNEQIQPWTDKYSVRNMLLIVSGGTFIAPGLLPGIALSGAGCSDYGLNSVMCMAGLSLNCVFVLPLIATASYVSIIGIQQCYADRYNTQVRQDISRYRAGRKDEDTITKDELAQFARMLMSTRSPLLKKLALAHALLLAKLDLSFFRGLVADDKFNEAVTISAIRLLKMVDMEASGLADALENVEVLGWLKKEPALLESLIELLPPAMKSEENFAMWGAIKNALAQVIGSASIDYADLLQHIQEGHTINSFILSTVTVDKNNPIIQLVTKGATYHVPKEALIAVSEYFKATLNKDWFEKSKDLSEVDAAWVAVLVNMANKQELDFDDDHLLIMLNAARYFQMPSLLSRCDNVLGEQGISDKLLKLWVAQSPTKPDISEKGDEHFQLRWLLCTDFDLSISKEHLLPKFCHRVNQLVEWDDSALIDLKLLGKADLAKVSKKFNFAGLAAKLNDPQYLKWVWPRAKEFPFLKNGVAAYCKDPNNIKTVCQVWLVASKDLQEAMDELPATATHQ